MEGAGSDPTSSGLHLVTWCTRPSHDQGAGGTASGQHPPVTVNCKALDASGTGVRPSNLFLSIRIHVFPAQSAKAFVSEQNKKRSINKICFYLERYPSWWRGGPAKTVGRNRVARVRVSSSPPTDTAESFSAVFFLKTMTNNQAKEKNVWDCKQKNLRSNDRGW